VSKTLEDYIQSQKDSEKKLIKVAFFDIDGTLLGLDGNYTEQLKISIKRIKELGVKTAIASGRPSFATKFIWQELGLTDAGVYCTGAHIYEPKIQQSHLTHFIAPHLVAQIIEVLRKSNFHYELYTESNFYVERNNFPEILATHTKHMRIHPILTHFDKVSNDVVKILVGVNARNGVDSIQSLEQAFPQCIFAYASLPAYPEWSFASIIDKKACKRAAFEYLLKIFNVTPENVISFGDAQADMTFISMAGIGVAMGNAAEPVKAISDIVTTPVWDNGVAKVLDALI
jgi:Cof subfamily protein (haloacid dehalogenase superfamily)